KTYDGTTGATASGTAALSGAVEGDDVALDGTGSYSFAQSAVGTAIEITTTGYTLTGSDAVNYTLAQPTLSANIKARTILVNPDSGQTKEYGESDPEITYIYSGEVVGEIPDFVNNLGRVQGENVGTYEIVQGALALQDNGSFKASNYQLELVTLVDFTITKAMLTVRANNDSKFVTQADGTGYAGVSYIGLKFGENETVLDTSNLTIVRTNTGVEAAGAYGDVLEVSGVTAQNYDITYDTGDFTIVPADQLLFKLKDIELDYGGTSQYEVAEVGYYSSGSMLIVDLTQNTQINGTQVTVTDGASGTAVFDIAVPSAELSTSGNLKVGSYLLELADVTVTSPNFSNTIVLQGNLEVRPKELTVSIISGKTKVYDGNDQILNLTLALSNPITEDVLAVNGVGQYDRKDSGFRSYTVTSLSLSGVDARNYFIQGGANAIVLGTDGEIAKRPLIITPDAGQGKLFGESDPILTYSQSGVVLGETPGFGGALAREAGELQGTYAIELGTLALVDNGNFLVNNYSLDFTTGVLFAIGRKVINAPEITVEAIAELTYTGQAQEPKLLVKDGAYILTEGTDYSVAYSNNVDVGTALVTITGIGNYIGTRDQTFEIVNKEIRVIVADQGKNYGDVDFELVYSLDPELFGTDRAGGSLEREVGEAVGLYAISLGSLTAGPNYLLVLEGNPEFEIRSVDSDGDGVPDDVEEQQGTDPNDATDVLDSDGDGVPDYVEEQQGTDIYDVTDVLDSDGDGVPD
ncbi:MBG domain-containing protein, partial [Flagellimonas marinaquae]|uniref:MBG domain-containing protein n=1 Tax=Flagellimonas marinaquae TaxID=254955 RepID=UPI001F493F37